MELKCYVARDSNTKQWILDTDLGYRYTSPSYDDLKYIMKDIYDKKLIILKIDKISEKHLKLYINQKDVSSNKIKVHFHINKEESVFEFSKNSLFYEVKNEHEIMSISVYAYEELLNEYVIVIEKRED